MAHGGVGCDVGDRQRAGEFFADPGQQRGKGGVGDGRHGLVDELALAAFSVSRVDEATADQVGDLGTVILPDDVQAEIERRIEERFDARGCRRRARTVRG